MLITVLPAQEALAGEDAAVTTPAGDGPAAPGATAGGVDLTGVVVVQVSGDIDLYTGPELRARLRELLPAPLHRSGPSVDIEHPPGKVVRAVVVDLRQVDFMDSYALGVLVDGHHRARPGGRAYAVVASSELVRKLFELTGLTLVMPLHPDLPTALTHLRPAASGTPER